MPFRLQISNEEVRSELIKMGYINVSEEMVNAFRKDLLKLIKHDLKFLKNKRKFESDREPQIIGKTSLEPLTSTPTSYTDNDLSDQRTESEVTSSGYSETSITDSDSKKSDELKTSALSDSEDLDKEAALLKKDQHTKKELRKMTTGGAGDSGLPPYPARPDPVNLYHYYKAHWDKFKIPGEDPRSALRWEVRSQLFYSS